MTATEIKVGVLVPDLGPLSDAGYSAFVGDIEEHWRTYFDDLNARGGVLGRKVVPVFVVYDALSKDEMRAACTRLTQDEKVFAAFNAAGFYSDPILCLTEQNQTPYFAGDGSSEEFFERSRGLMFSTSQSKNRILRNKVAALHAAGVLDGARVGVLYDDEPENRDGVETGLLPTLESYGFEGTVTYRLSADVGAAQSQVPLAVQQMCNVADVVFLPVGFPQATQFVTQAERQQCGFRYFTSDFAIGSSDFYAQQMPDSFDGALAVTAQRIGEQRVDRPEPEVDVGCRRVWEERKGEAAPRGSGDYGGFQAACGLVRVFEVAANRAGPELTRPRLSAAVQQLGEVSIPFYGGGSFSKGKLNAADFVQLVQWKRDCRCWSPVTAFARARF